MSHLASDDNETMCVCVQVRFPSRHIKPYTYTLNHYWVLQSLRDLPNVAYYLLYSLAAAQRNRLHNTNTHTHTKIWTDGHTRHTHTTHRLINSLPPKHGENEFSVIYKIRSGRPYYPHVNDECLDVEFLTLCTIF